MDINRKVIFAMIFLSLTTGCGEVTALPTPMAAPTQDSLLPTPTIIPPTAMLMSTPLSATDTPIPVTEIPTTATPWPQVINPGPYDIRALLVLPKDVGPNWYLIEDNYELLGWDLTLAGARESIPPCASAKNFYNLRNVSPDILLPEVDDIGDFHAVSIMPASKKNQDPYGDLINSVETLDLLRSGYDHGLGVYAACGGVRVLAAADILDGRSVTGEPSYQAEYEAAGATFLGDYIMPVVDGNLVTSRRGLYYNIENSQALAIALENTMPTEAGDVRDTCTVEFEIPERDAAWTKTFGGSSADGARAIRPTSDGGFIIVGYTFSFGAGYADVYLVKHDIDGNLIWSHSYGGPGWDYGNAVAETLDGGYLIAGYTTSMGAGSRDIYLLKTDAAGNLIWSQAYGGPALDVGNSVAVAPDGGYIVVGHTESFGAGENDVYMIKVDTEGNEEWSRTFGAEAAEMGMAISGTSDGNFVVAGATGSLGVLNRDFYLIKVSDQGNMLWSRTYGQGEFLPYEWGNAVIETSDGGFLMAGNSNVNTQQGTGELLNMYLVKTDDQGNEVWTSYIGRGQGYDYANAVHQTKDGEFIVVGATKSGSNNNDIYLIKVSASGETLWKKSFGDFGSEWGSDLALTADGSIFIVGQTNSFGSGSFDVWLVKVPIE